MPDSRADELIRRYERLASERAALEPEWREIARLVRPMRGEFALANGVSASRRLTDVLDGTAIMAADNLASGLWGALTNSANAWFALKHPIEDLNEDQAVKTWLDVVTRRMLAALGGDGQRFYARAIDLYGDLVCFGTGVFSMEEDPVSGRLLFGAASHGPQSTSTSRAAPSSPSAGILFY
ncbi:MAG: portal protein [Alphaproteobacteria bacterium]